MPTGDAYSSGHLVLSHFGTCMCSNVETNLSWTCLVSGLLNFEHPSVLLFCSKEVLWSVRGSYQTIWGPPLPNVTRHSGWWPHTVTPSIDKTLHQFLTITDLDLITEFDLLPNWTRFPKNICNGCGMPTEDAYSSGHLVLSHFGTCMCSNVETTLSWTCLVSGLLNFEHPSVLLFCLLYICDPVLGVWKYFEDFKNGNPKL